MNAHLSNLILNSLPDQGNGFRSKLTAVPLPVGTSIYEPHEVPKFAHFLTSGIASIVTTMKDGGSVETGMWASDGMVECMHIGGAHRVPTRCFMQVGGTALRMPFADLEKEFDFFEAFAHQHSAQHPEAGPDPGSARSLQPSPRGGGAPRPLAAHAGGPPL